jgi:hypothetical protein
VRNLEYGICQKRPVDDSIVPIATGVIGITIERVASDQSLGEISRCSRRFARGLIPNGRIYGCQQSYAGQPKNEE